VGDFHGVIGKNLPKLGNRNSLQPGFDDVSHDLHHLRPKLFTRLVDPLNPTKKGLQNSFPIDICTNFRLLNIPRSLASVSYCLPSRYLTLDFYLGRVG
jgi:hypothetical protein